MSQREFTFGNETFTGTLDWQAEFAPSDQWLFESQGGTLEFADGQAHVDCVDRRGATLWVRRPFPSDLLIEFAGVSLPPSVGKNFNLFFAAHYPDGRTIEQVARSGAYQEYHEFPNYIFTLTCSHTRMRRDPGFEQLAELMLGSIDEHRYLVQVAKRGGRLQACIDGHLIHDATDPDPHGGGYVGLRTWHSRIIYDHWAIYRL